MFFKRIYHVSYQLKYLIFILICLMVFINSYQAVRLNNKYSTYYDNNQYCSRSNLRKRYLNNKNYADDSLFRTDVNNNKYKLNKKSQIQPSIYTLNRKSKLNYMLNKNIPFDAKNEQRIKKQSYEYAHSNFDQNITPYPKYSPTSVLPRFVTMKNNLNLPSNVNKRDFTIFNKYTASLGDNLIHILSQALPKFKHIRRKYQRNTHTSSDNVNCTVTKNLKNVHCNFIRSKQGQIKKKHKKYTSKLNMTSFNKEHKKATTKTPQFKEEYALIMHDSYGHMKLIPINPHSKDFYKYIMKKENSVDLKKNRNNDARKSILRLMKSVNLCKSENATKKKEGSPCDLNGCWESKIGGVRLDITIKKSGKMLISISDTVPINPGILSKNWILKGQSSLLLGGPFSITATNSEDNKIANFIGQCRVCQQEDIITGWWIIGRAACDCIDVPLTVQFYADIFRRNVLNNLEQKCEEHSKNKTTQC